MDRVDTKSSILERVLNDQDQFLTLLFIPFVLLLIKRGTDKFNISQIDVTSLERKSRLLNRIRGYMEPEEQDIVYRAEIILQIIGKLKYLLEGSEMRNAEVRYNSLSLEDRRRNMLLDLSEYIHEDKRDIIYKAVDMDIKAKKMQKKLKDVKDMQENEISVESMDKYIEVFEPVLEGELKGKVKELRKLLMVLKLVKSVEKKEKIDETDIIEAIEPFLDDQQGEALKKMVQIFKAISNIGNEDTNKDTKEESEKSDQLTKDEEAKELKENDKKNSNINEKQNIDLTHELEENDE